MRVMILGGTGFIGSALTLELLRRGHDVVITSRKARHAHKESQKGYAPAHTGDGSPTDAYHILRQGEGIQDTFVPAFAMPGEAVPSMRFLYAMGQEEERPSMRASSGSQESRSRHLVRDLVAAASGYTLPGSFWKTAEELGSINGTESDAFLFSSIEGFAQEERRAEKSGQAQSTPSYEVWDGVDEAQLAPILGGIDAVVNLIGEYLGGRWNDEKKAELRDSRIHAGKALARAFVQRAEAGEEVPSTVIQVSAVGYYGRWREFECAPVCEEGMKKGRGFLADLAADWEASSAPVEEVELVPHEEDGQAPGNRVRRCVARLAPVLGEGGFLKHVIPLYKAGFGGIPGTGRQPCAWVHVEDVARAMAFMLEQSDMRGVYNVCASPDDTMRGLSEALGWALHKPVWLPMPEVTLRLTMGEVADELLLSGQRISSQKLQDAGFHFRYPTLDEAVLEVVGKKRQEA